ALHLAWLKHHVAIRKNYRLTEAVQMGDDFERVRVQPLREWIVDQERGHQQQPRIVATLTLLLRSIALQRSEVVGVAELAAQLLEDLPIAITARLTELALQMVAQIILHAIVVEQSVVHIQQENRPELLGHAQAPSVEGLYQIPSGAISASASLGPQL